MKYAIAAVEVRGGKSPYERREQLLNEGFKSTRAHSCGVGYAYVKECDSIDEICNMILWLHDNKFGNDTGIIIYHDYPEFYSFGDVEIYRKDMFTEEMKDAKKEIYLFRKSHKIY